MIKYIGLFIAGVITLVALAVILIEFDDNAEVVGVRTRRVPFVAFFILVIVLLWGSVSKVPVNSVGVKYSDIRGTISEDAYRSGLHVKIPFIDKMTTVSTELRSADIDDMQITSADSQEITLDIELQYRVLPEDAVETFKQFRSTPEDKWINTFVYQRIQRGVQNAASNYTVIEIMGSKRGDFQKEVDETVAEAMTNNHLTVHTSSVDDLKVSDAIKKSIEANAKAKQDVETARQIKAKNEVENETKVDKAKAEAEVKNIEAQAESEANRKLSEGITTELVEYLEALARQEHGWYKYNNMNPQIMEEE